MAARTTNNPLLEAPLGHMGDKWGCMGCRCLPVLCRTPLGPGDSRQWGGKQTRTEADDIWSLLTVPVYVGFVENVVSIM